MPARKLFEKQLHKATHAEGGVDMTALAELVIEAYEEAERDRRRTERSMQLMINELDELNHRDREQLLATLKAQNQRFETALDNMMHGLCMFDGDHCLIVCNRRYAQMYGLPPQLTAPGVALAEITDARIANGSFPKGDPQAYVAEVQRLARLREPWQRTWELNDGRVIEVYSSVMASGGWIATHHDITEQRRAEARISHMARHDALDNLPNRQYFHERLVRHLRRASDKKPIAVLSLDLDHFKNVNDAFGHPVGDGLLLAVADRLRGCVRDTDVVARLGGDEFLILQNHADQPIGATTLAQRVVDSLGAPYMIGDQQVTVTTSVGISVAPNDGLDADLIVKSAELALYKAKDEGRGTYRFFEADMDSDMKARRRLELDLRQGLALGEFLLYYQPVIDLAANAVNGMEALLRWKHPERGLVSPLDFVPLAEEIGLIIPIGEWVIRHACEEAVTWPHDVAVAVNLSPAQFKSKNSLLNVVTSALTMSGLSPHRLIIEITETVLMQENDFTLSILHQLRSLGVRICMDDFGTGYSSLGYLRRFPFDKIKIDRSFIKDLPERRDSLSIVRAVTGLGQSLGIPTTAEGVENASQVEMLRASGCTEVQGFYFSPPRPADDIPRMLAELKPQRRAVA